MPPLFARFRTSRQMQHITDAPALPKTLIGSAPEHLERHLTLMYWDAVKEELINIVHALQELQRTDFELPKENDTFIHGYDAFLENVAQPPRPKIDYGNDDAQEDFAECTRRRAREVLSDLKMDEVRAEVRQNVPSAEPDSTRKRARLLLQSAQWLDIDKLIEHREPARQVRLAPAQLVSVVEDRYKQLFPGIMTVPNEDESDEEEEIKVEQAFEPLLCALCHDIVRGTMFQHVYKYRFICEGCYWAKHYGDPQYSKRYKSCSIDGGVPETAEIGSKMRPSRPREEYCDAKYATTQVKLDKGLTMADCLAKMEKEEQQRSSHGLFTRPDSTSSSSVRGKAQVPEFGGWAIGKDEPIPLYLRTDPSTHHLDGMHMAIRLGPLIIENGVENTEGGAVITTRHPIHARSHSSPPGQACPSLLLVGNDTRQLYSQARRRVPRRYQAVMKQVVGGEFSGFWSKLEEDELVDMLVECSEALPNEPPKDDEKLAALNPEVDQILNKLRAYFGPRSKFFLSTLVKRLLDPGIDMKWTRMNNCQVFCDNLINLDVFRPLFAGEASLTEFGGEKSSPVYLLSFVCRPGSLAAMVPIDGDKAPTGHIEEYLLRMVHGRHEESNVIDSLSEYWCDWGALKGPITRYQDLFPWDCTDASDSYAALCGDCNLSRHVWAFPFDSWSILTMHISREIGLYPKSSAQAMPSFVRPGFHPETSNDHGHMAPEEWFRNRMTVLLAHDALLTVATSMAQAPTALKSSTWLTDNTDPTLDRVKMGGIERAQPFSHHYHKAAGYNYFLAEWCRSDENDEALNRYRKSRSDVIDSYRQKSLLGVSHNRSDDRGNTFVGSDYVMRWAHHSPYLWSRWSVNDWPNQDPESS